MGWIVTRSWSIREGKSTISFAPMEEPAGFQGERITPSGQSPKDKANWFTIPRAGRIVHSKRGALRAAEERGNR